MSQAEIILIQPDVVRRILSTFTGLQNIALFDTWSAGDDTFFKNANQKSKIGQHLRPRSLTCHLERFFAIHTIPNRQPDFALPFFSRLTHLEILDPVKTWSLWTGLELIPRLTHLAFNGSGVESFWNNTNTQAFITRTLTTCRNLEILVFFAHSGGRTQWGTEVVDKFLDTCGDPRCVVLPISNPQNSWDASFLGMPHCWSIAKDLIRT